MPKVPQKLKNLKNNCGINKKPTKSISLLIVHMGVSILVQKF